MPTNNFCAECVDDLCVDAALPALVLGSCDVDNDEGITEVFYTDQGHPVAGDPASAASWTTRLSNTSDGTGGSGNVANPIRHYEVYKGKKPQATLNYKKNQKGTGVRLQDSTRSITFKDEDDSDGKYEFYRNLQCNGNILLYYRSGKHFYGSNGSTGAGSGVGIKAVIKPVYEIDPESATMAHAWFVTIEWDAKCEEGRFEAPF
ncbi:hypothetical protein [Spirosoma sp. 48-14]|uniref:hypothetical protein n=1 Tax=Spirosoma sp. 48-14 TaxID=1895854 RepID=UPI0009626ECE|nr:hypothetical protein [Spirosoma sp. 48-14]OJW75705.1 MAG: hypothetical protein BGO59_09065 [Spirosoma sp. 48-14]